MYYLLGEEFDRDPFLIFKLRGMPREELLAAIKPASGEPTETPQVSVADVENVDEPSRLEPEPLSPDPLAFWNGEDFEQASCGRIEVLPVAAALPHRLDNFPFWRGSEPLLDTLEMVNAAAPPVGTDAFLGQAE